MRRIDYLIEDVRRHTENDIVNISDTVGIQDEEFLRFINDAQHRLHSLIIQKHPSVFIGEKTYNVVVDQEEYTLPSDIFLSNKVVQVEYSDTNDVEDYYKLELTQIHNRMSGIEGLPMGYIRKNNSITLTPVPDRGGLLRVLYVKAPLKLDKRRGSVASVTLDSGTSTITALAFNVSTDTIDSTELLKDNYFTVVDRNGNVKMKNIEYDSIDTTTGIITITSSFTYESGESISVGDYIVRGKQATTHSEFPDTVERYFIAYCAWKILKRDSSIDSTEQQDELLAMEAEIVDSYADIEEDIVRIPEIGDHFQEWWS